MRTVLAFSAALFFMHCFGCAPTEPSGADAESPEADASGSTDLPTVDADELPADYVRVPGLNVAVKADGQWDKEFKPSRGGHAWPRWNDEGVVAGSIHFQLMPKVAATPQAQSEMGAAAIKKAPFFVAEGDQNRAIEIDGRDGYVISYRSKLDQKNLYNIQVTVVYDDTQYLLATCSYETSLIDDISQEQLEKLREIRFLSSSQ